MSIDVPVPRWVVEIEEKKGKKGGSKEMSAVEDMQRTLVRCMRHGSHGCVGRFAPGGLFPVDVLLENLGAPYSLFEAALGARPLPDKAVISSGFCGSRRLRPGDPTEEPLRRPWLGE